MFLLDSVIPDHRLAVMCSVDRVGTHVVVSVHTKSAYCIGVHCDLDRPSVCPGRLHMPEFNCQCGTPEKW